MPPSPAIRLSADGVTYGAPGLKMSFSAGATVHAKLDSIQGVSICTWTILFADAVNSTVSDYTIVPDTGAVVGDKVKFNLPAATEGVSVILQSTINNEVDTYNNNNPTATQATIKAYVLAPNGLEIPAVGEEFESDPVYGTAPQVSAAIYAAGVAGGGVTTARQINTTAPLTGGGDLSVNRTLAIAPATDSSAGSMSAADKATLDEATSSATAGALVARDGNGAAAFASVTTQSVTNGNITRYYGYGTATTLPTQLQSLGASIPIGVGTAWILRATFTGKLVGPTTTLIYEQDVLLEVANVSGTLIARASGGIDATSLWKSTAPLAPWSGMSGVNSASVTNVVNDGSGHCQVSVSVNGNLRNGSTVVIAGVSGVPGANGSFTVDSLSGNTFVARGSSFSGAYVSGGTVTTQACVTASLTNPLQLQVEGLTPALWVAGETVNAGDIRQAGGNVYLYTTGGTVDGSTPPSGTGTGIHDGGAITDYLCAVGAGPSIAWTCAELTLIEP